MGTVDILRKKRDGHRLENVEIDAFVRGVVDGSWSDYQASALLMAIFLRGMDAAETAHLTRAMVDSGQRLDFSDLDGPKVDKHSTGGVGDKTSLILAPLVAACGVYVPMMSGRGLGHTGGTLDKLEAMAGFRVRMPLPEMRTILREVGCVMIGASAEIAPADRKLYSLRDVTATVESIPLITASILSKKIAEGIGGLVMDVKSGNGAFMKDLAGSRALAKSIVANGNANGVRTEAMITDMNAPLGTTIGNALEVKECIALLKNEPGDHDLKELTLALAERMVALAGKSDARKLVEEAWSSGRALEKFRLMVEKQGADPRVVDDPGLMPVAPHKHLMRAETAGWVESVEALALGQACMRIGAGRNRVEDVIDPAVGAIVVAKAGMKVAKGDVLAEIHCRDEASLTPVLDEFRRAFAISPTETKPASSLILETVV